jgi:hypothetical protein
MVIFTPLPLYPRGIAHGTHEIRGWVDPRAGLNMSLEKWKELFSRENTTVQWEPHILM